MFNALLSPFRVKRIFDRAALMLDLRADLQLLRALGSAALPQRQPDGDADAPVFAPAEPLEVPALRGKKVGLVATGGGGAMVCAIGVMRALEEAGLEIAAISSCSGSALALSPIAAGLSAEQTARFMLGWRRSDYLQPDWSALLRAPLTLGRGFTGLADTRCVEQLYTELLGPVTVGQLPIPFYANIWDVDHNRLLYPGTRNDPELSLARLVRAAMALAGFMQPVAIDGTWFSDGGAVNIFPVDPLVEHHPEIDLFIGVNAFHPPGFDGVDLSGWHRLPFSILRAANQNLTAQHMESARMQLRRIADRCVLIEPLPYEQVRGIKLYEHFLDRRHWPEFIQLGHQEARRVLSQLG